MVAVIAKLERRVRILAAVVRLLLALLRTSGFRLSDKRLPQGAAKACILRTITSAASALPLAVISKILGLPASRYHAWSRAAKGCGLDDRPSCPRSSHSQMAGVEVAVIKDMVLDPQYRHMPADR